MQHRIIEGDENKVGKLVITIDADEQAELRELIEPLVCNSELQWINPEDTGDLTDAPMLGILGEESTENTGPFGAIQCGFWDGKPRFQPILNRWAFMESALRSPLEDLLEKGEVVFVDRN